MKIQALFRAAAFLFAVTTSTASAESISIRGIDWSMSQSEQVAVLESAGLDCVRERGWDAFVSPTKVSASNNPMPMCFADQGSGANVDALRDAFNDWHRACSTKGGRSDACFNHPFKDLRDRLRMVWFQNGGRIIFECEYIGSCAYSLEEVVRQIQRRVVNSEFRKPTEDAYVVCANGDEGDSICVHLHSQAIWLIQNPDQGSIRF
ncbi:hypothetical protein SAMN04490248_11584 [Salinihabitans flavidus]|uniref:Uncharacterized protein n=1 Tax=Salinihabitans flavidus TaxID=569882 RepID=A0A1H8THQ2_9RHOB|nr:hypothetical protein [Salinihabitans flavidus]SEO90073.1 hypothetical protein SAMN04490248_11584 [Salinihabitans flavidus]